MSLVTEEITTNRGVTRVSHNWRRRLQVAVRGSNSPGLIILVGAALLLTVGYPLAWLIAQAFGAPDTWSLSVIASAYTSDATLVALKNTVLLAVGCAVLSGLMGVALAWLVVATDIRHKRAINIGVAVAFVIPPYLVALAYQILAAPRSGYLNRLFASVWGGGSVFNVDNMWGVIFVASLHGYAFVYFFTANALRSVDPSLEQSAKLLGTRGFGVARRITLPLVAPAVTSGMLLAGIQATVMLGTQLYLGTPGQVPYLTTALYGRLESIPSDSNTAAALALLLVLLTCFGLAVRRVMAGRRSYVTVAGKPGDRTPARLGLMRIPAYAVTCLVLLISTVLPGVILLGASFSKNWLSAPSLANMSVSHYYDVLVTRSDTRQALMHSLDYSLISASACVVLAFLVAYLRYRRTTKTRSALMYLATAPLGLPGVVLAVGLIGAWIYLPVAVYGTMWILVLAYVAGHLPIAVQAASAALAQLHVSLEDAARMLGARSSSAIVRIALPLTRPSLVTAWVLVFVPMMAEFGATLLLYSPGTATVSVAIYDLQDRGSIEDMCALSIVTGVLTLLVAGVFVGVVRLSSRLPQMTAAVRAVLSREA